MLSSRRHRTTNRGTASGRHITPLGGRVLVQKLRRRAGRGSLLSAAQEGVIYGRVMEVGTAVEAPVQVGSLVMVPDGVGDTVDGGLVFFKDSDLISMVEGVEESEFEPLL